MKNLYDRLKPSIRKNIQDDLKRYPASTRILIKTFKSNDLWQDLKVSDVQRLVLWSNMSLVEISHNDLMYGDKFLVNDDEYIVSITGQYGVGIIRRRAINANVSLMLYSNNNNGFNKYRIIWEQEQQ